MRAILCLLLLASAAFGRGEEAVVRIPSHGGSGTVIATQAGSSLILAAAHMFEGQDRSRRVVLDVPAPVPAGPKPLGGSTVLAVWPREDLALIRVNVGPLPYVCPVAPAGWQPKRTVSCGYDSMQMPGRGPQVYPATIVAVSDMTYTRERPWHGRSGGGLIDPDAGMLIGVVSGYEDSGPPHNRGIYATHAAVLRMVSQYGGAKVTQPSRPQPCPT